MTNPTSIQQLIPFTYEGRPVRIVAIDSEPWFVLADLCRVLGLTRGAAQVSERLDDGVRQPYPIQDSMGRTQQATIVSEAGMYEVVIRSDKPEAAEFRRWITSEVLPAIRKTGSYSTAPALTEDEIVHQALQIQGRKIRELEAAQAELQPKADAWDQIVSSAASWSYEEAAKVLFDHGVISIGQKRLVKQLVAWGYLYRDHKGRPHAYQRHIESGLFVTKARTYMDMETGERRESSAPQVRITGKGLDMLFKRFREGQLEVAS